MALVVVTGGARSGKSAVAQRLAAERRGEVVVVVFGEGDTDPEMAERIARHETDRPDGWRTWEPETPDGWLDGAPDDALIVVDCLGTLLGRLMAEAWAASPGAVAFGEAAVLPEGYADAVERRLSAVVDGLRRRRGDTLVVTNEIGGGVVPAFATGRLFRDLLGRANRGLVTDADAAWLVVAGRCVELTSFPVIARWPAD